MSKNCERKRLGVLLRRKRCKWVTCAALRESANPNSFCKNAVVYSVESGLAISLNL